MKKNRFYTLVLVFILLLVFILDVYCINDYSIAEDEGDFLYGAWRVSEGDELYKDWPADQMPLTYYFLAFMFKIFGPTIFVARLSMIFVMLATAVFLYLITRKIFSPLAGIVAVLLFLLNEQIYTHSIHVMMENFMVLFYAIGIFLFLLAYKKRNKFLYFFSGFSFALATLSKLLAPVLFLTGCFLFFAYLMIFKRKSIKGIIHISFIFILGFILPLIPIILLFYFKAGNLYYLLIGSHVLAIEKGMIETLALFCLFFKNNLLLILATIPFFIKSIIKKSNLAMVISCQIITCFWFFLMPTPLYYHHFLYLVFFLVIFSSGFLTSLLHKNLILKLVSILIVIVIIFPFFNSYIKKDIEYEESVFLQEKDFDLIKSIKKSTSSDDYII